MIKVEVSGDSVLSFLEIKRIIKRALERVKMGKALISVAFVREKEIEKWNRLYKGKGRPTDVLSFGFSQAVGEDKKYKYFGEILISEAQAKKNVKGQARLLRGELRQLLVHGVLHLAGFDHRNKKEGKKMLSLQKKIINS